MKKWIFFWISAFLWTLPAWGAAESLPQTAISADAVAPEPAAKIVPLAQRGRFDVSAWAQLPICRDGRIMPLDAFARTHVRLICGRENPRIRFEDGTKRKFQASEILFSWLVEPEAWKEISFLPLEEETLREWVGLPVFDENGMRLTTVSPAQLSHAFNSVAFNEKLSRTLQTLEESEALLSQMKAKGITSGKDFQRENEMRSKNRRLQEKLEVLENRYVTWLHLTVNPLRNLTPENDSTLRDSAYVPYMGQTVTISYLEQNLIYLFCNSYEPRLSLRGAEPGKISPEELAQIRSELQVPDEPGRKFTPAELYVSFRKNPKLWKHVPFLYLANEEVRKVLGLPVASGKDAPLLFVAPMELVTAIQKHSAAMQEAMRTLSGEARSEMNRLEMGLQLYCCWLDGQFLENVPLGERFYSDYESLRGCWLGTSHSAMGPAQPLDVQLLTIILQRNPMLFQKMAAGWRSVSPRTSLNEALGAGSISAPQWDFLLSCMAGDSSELALFKAFRRVGAAFREVDSALNASRKSDPAVSESAALSASERLKLLSRKLAELKLASDALTEPLTAYCRSARAMLPAKPSETDSEWYSYLVISRVSLRNFAKCVSALQYAPFDEDLALCVLPAVEGVPLDRDRTEKVQIFARNFPLHCQPWLSLNALRFGAPEQGFAAAWPEAGRKGMAEIRGTFQKMASAWQANDPSAFLAASRLWASQLRETASALAEARSKVLPEEQLDVEALAQTRYPAADFTMKLETSYSRFRPFTWAWILPFISTLILGASASFEFLALKAAREPRGEETAAARSVFERFGNLAFWLGFTFLVLGLLASTAGLALRSWIMNRAPVTNMFETIVFVAWSAGVLGVFLTFRIQFARILSLGWSAVKFSAVSGDSVSECSGLPFRVTFWFLRVVLALALFGLLCFYGLGNGSGYTAIRLTPSCAIGASLPSLSAWVEWLTGILMLGTFLWWVPLFLLAPIAGFLLYANKNQWSDDETHRLSRQRFQRPFFAGAAAFVVFVISYVSISFPDVFKPDLRNLAPILRDNYWLAVHVVTIVASYGAGMLAWGLANGSLCCYLFGRYRIVDGKRLPPEICSTLSELLYRCIQAAVLLLVVGTILGGLWADVSWGKFWSWDRKEVWALISLFVYLLILHGRYVRLLGEFTLAIGAVLGAFAIVMAWYGVNYVMGSALHGYGAGTGSLVYAGLIVGLNLLLIFGAVVRYLTAQKA